MNGSTFSCATWLSISIQLKEVETAACGDIGPTGSSAHVRIEYVEALRGVQS
jgi:hypothetical protein